MTLKPLHFAGNSPRSDRSLTERLTQMAIWLVNEPERTSTAVHRGREIERLNAMTDAELLTLELTRDKIVAHVFQNMADS